MNLFFKIFLYVSLLIVTLIDLSAQANIIINGKILDEKGAGLPGATIIVKGTNIGALGNIDGTFQLTNVRELPVTLIISSVGYTHQEVKVNKDETLTVTLSIDINKLDEVVIVGYGTQKRKELTGAVSSVPKSALEHVTPSFDGMLGGTVAGVNVTQSSGQPGSASSIRIRGGNSVYASNEPLYVIDGFIFYSDNSSTKAGINGIEGNLNPLASINPKDIESIEVLKDVSATAIYGSRGANGVIIVTTKKGKNGENSISYQYTTGWNNSVKKMDLMNTVEWARVQKDYFNNKGKYTDEEIAQLGEGYNWQDAVLKKGPTQTHELSINGRDKTRYLISANYTDQQGIILNSGFERFSSRVNLDRDLFSNFSIGIIATADKSTQNSLTTFEDVNFNDSPYSHGITNSLTYALYIPPVVPIYNVDGIDAQGNHQTHCAFTNKFNLLTDNHIGPADIILVNRFNDNDTRKKYSYTTELINPLDLKTNYFTWPVTTSRYGKFIHRASVGNKLSTDDQPNDIDHIDFRYAEVLLIKAEALFSLGRASEALPLVNQIRQRAFGSDHYNLTTLTKEDLYKEWDLEFTYEQKHWTNLVRWRTLISTVKTVSGFEYFKDKYASEASILSNFPGVDVNAASFAKIYKHLHSKYDNVKGKFYRFPIPLGESGEDLGITPQNPGY